MSLKPLVFETLLALSGEPRHGWSLVGEVEERLGDERLLPGNFYRTLRRLLADGLIEEAPAPPRSGAGSGPSNRAGDEERRRYFQLTREGARVLRDEAHRLERLVRDARTQRVLRTKRG